MTIAAQLATAPITAGTFGVLSLVGPFANAVDEDRLAHIEETLDQCWDLLRQRRALREFGEDPSEAQVRGEGTVEHYQQ